MSNRGEAPFRDAVARNIPLIGGVVIGAFVIGWLVSSSLTPTYRATSQVSFSQIPSTRTLLADADVDPERALALRALNVTQPAVLSGASELLPTREEAVQPGDVSVDYDSFLGTVRLTVSSSDPEVAAQVATAVAESAAAWEANDAAGAVGEAVARLEGVVDRADAAVAELEAQVVEQPGSRIVQARLDDAVSRVLDAQAHIDELLLQQATVGGGVDRVDPASVPGNPVSPVPLRDASIFALMAGIAVTGLLWYRRLTSTEWTALAEEALGAPVLASLPAPPSRPLEDPRRMALADAILRMALHAMREGGAKALTVTSVDAGEVVPTLATELAHAAARSGRMVLLVKTHGATEARPGRGGSSGGFRRGNDRPLKVEGGLPPAQVRDRLRVVDVRDLRGDEPALVLGEHLATSASTYDVVIVDAPPMADVAVSSTLEAAEAVLVVTAPGVSTGTLSSARRTLDLLGADVIGFVLRKARRVRSSEAPSLPASSSAPP